MKISDHSDYYTGPAASVMGCKYCSHLETRHNEKFHPTE